MEQDELLREIRKAIDDKGGDPSRASALMQHIDGPDPSAGALRNERERRQKVKEHREIRAQLPIGIRAHIPGGLLSIKKRPSKTDFLNEIHEIAGRPATGGDVVCNPEADAQLCAVLKGEVRISYGLRVLYTALPAVLGLLSLLFGVVLLSPSFLFLASVCLAGAVVLHLHQSRWRLVFDGSTGWFEYRDRQGKEQRFHVTEIFDRQYVRKEHGQFGKYDRIMVLNVDGTEIEIHTGTYRSGSDEPLEFSLLAHTGYKKLEDYLDAYDRLSRQPDAREE